VNKKNKQMKMKEKTPLQSLHI